MAKRIFPCKTPAERFWPKVRIGGFDQCWIWTGSVRGGYGGFGFQTVPQVKVIGAHQASWKLVRGDIPKGQCVLHTCDNHFCVNPLHLFLGTKTDNNKDRDAKGRQAKGERNGHAIITEDQVHKIRALHVPDKFGAKKIGSALNIPWWICHQVLQGITWRHVQ